MGAPQGIEIASASGLHEFTSLGGSETAISIVFVFFVFCFCVFVVIYMVFLSAHRNRCYLCCFVLRFVIESVAIHVVVVVLLCCRCYLLVFVGSFDFLVF